MKEGKTITQVAKELNITKGSVSMRLRAVRERYRKAKVFVETYEKHRSEIPTKFL